MSTYSLAQRAALANGDPVTFLNTESRGNVSGDVLVPLLVTVVLGDVVEVFTADDDGTVHLGRDDTASEDTATDRDLTGEGALLVCSAVSGCPHPRSSIFFSSCLAISQENGVVLSLEDWRRRNSLAGVIDILEKIYISPIGGRVAHGQIWPEFSFFFLGYELR